MCSDGKDAEEDGEGQVFGARNVPLLVGGVERVPAGHGGVKGNRLSFVNVLKKKSLDSDLAL